MLILKANSGTQQVSFEVSLGKLWVLPLSQVCSLASAIFSWKFSLTSTVLLKLNLNSLRSEQDRAIGSWYQISSFLDIQQLYGLDISYLIIINITDPTHLIIQATFAVALLLFLVGLNFLVIVIIIKQSQELMGSFRSQPDLTKHTYEMFSLDHSYAVTHMCGWRKYMEDASMIISPFTYRNYSLFGVFDGHGGPEVALYAQKHFPELLQKNQDFKAGKYQQALKDTFINLDNLLATPAGREEIEEIRKVQIEKGNTSEEGSITRIGCTCLVILVTKDSIYIANAGDCRAVAVTYSGSVKQITKDHKPHDADEEARIHRAGGYVENGRVNGCLNLSRALGDLEFKANKDLSIDEQAITPLPDVIKLSRNDLFFIVMCCDGVWECKSNDNMAEWIRRHLEDRVSLGKTLEGLFDEIVARDIKEEHGTDNMSAILIKFDKAHTPHSHSQNKGTQEHSVGSQAHHSPHTYSREHF